MNGRTLRSKHRGRQTQSHERPTRRSDTIQRARKRHQTPHTAKMNPGPYRLSALKLRTAVDYLDFLEKSVKELKREAKERGIKGYSKMSKADLAHNVSEHRRERLHRVQGR